MLRVINWKEYLVISSSLIILNLIHWSDPILNLVWGSLFLLFQSLVFGNWLFIKSTVIYKLLIGLLSVLAVASLSGVIFFYLFYLNNDTLTAVYLIIYFLGLLLISQRPVVLETAKINFKINYKVFALSLCYLALIGSIFYLSWHSRTSLSIRSPWEAVSLKIFWLYFLATFCLYTIFIYSRSQNIFFFIFLHFLVSFSLATIVYQIGFDYDPFIHRTNEALLLQTGTLLPKPFYYIGQYSLVIFLYHLLKIPLDWLDKILVPLLSAIYLPLIIYYAFRDNFKASAKIIFLIILSLLGLTYTNFISTTPQALANLMLIITIFLSLYFLEHPKGAFWPLTILSLFTLTIHPLAGIPCVFFTILVLLYHYFQKKYPLPKILHKGIFWEIAVLACLALPAAFFINSQTSSELKVGLNTGFFNNLLNFSHWQMPLIFYRPFISVTDLIYTYGKNLWLIILGLAVIGLIYFIRNEKFRTYFIYPLFSLIMLVNYLLIAFGLSFVSLISYEQQAYSLRILEISSYFLWPFIILALYLFFTKIFEQKKIFQLLTVILLSLGLTFSFYLSYPRVDQVEKNNGYSTSQADLKTVNFIEQQNKKQPYIVLASQTVSAAAIKELGFKSYYNGYFFYPVPTGGRLYQLFDELAYRKNSTANVISTARFLTGVNTVYLVINNYWTDSDNLIKEQQNSADEWYQIDDQDYIFKYSN